MIGININTKNNGIGWYLGADDGSRPKQDSQRGWKNGTEMDNKICKGEVLDIQEIRSLTEGISQIGVEVYEKE